MIASTVAYPLIIGHRGVSGYAVENSSHAFSLAMDLGCDGIELDVHVTRDRRLVVHHDPVLLSGIVIAEATLEEVRAVPLPDDTPIPTLEDVFALLAPHMHLFVEVKSLGEDSDDALLACLSAPGAPDAVHVHAFDHRILARLHRKAPALSLGALSSSYPLDPIGPVLACGARTLWQEHHLIDEALVTQCRDAGLQVIAWTVNRAVDADRLRGLRVAGLCGNWPERLQPPAD